MKKKYTRITFRNGMDYSIFEEKWLKPNYSKRRFLQVSGRYKGIYTLYILITEEECESLFEHHQLIRSLTDGNSMKELIGKANLFYHQTGEVL